MKPFHRKAAATLAVVALAGIGYQSAVGSEDTSANGLRASVEPPAAAGSAWKVSHYSESLDAELTDVAPVSADEGWAIGRQNEETGDHDNILLHRTGGKWKQAAVPKEIGEGFLSQVEASGPDGVWLFSQPSDGGAKPLAFRWDGKKWNAAEAPPSLDAASKRSATVAGPEDVWVLGGENKAHHWDGSKWSTSQLPAAASALGGGAEGDVWAVGFRDTSGDGDGPLGQPAAMNWDGKAWKLEKTPEYHFPDPAPPEETASLESVVSVSKNEVWAVGSHTFNHGEGGPEPEEESILLRWDGTKWKKAAADVADKATPETAADGAGGLVLSRSTHMNATGQLGGISKHKPVPGRSGKVEEVDKKQKFWPSETVTVPGTRQVWSVGVIELGAQGDANFRRGAVLTYEAK
jgi:hypothetical protein